MAKWAQEYGALRNSRNALSERASIPSFSIRMVTEVVRGPHGGMLSYFWLLSLPRIASRNHCSKPNIAAHAPCQERKCRTLTYETLAIIKGATPCSSLRTDTFMVTPDFVE